MTNLLDTPITLLQYRHTPEVMLIDGHYTPEYSYLHTQADYPAIFHTTLKVLLSRILAHHKIVIIPPVPAIPARLEITENEPKTS